MPRLFIFGLGYSALAFAARMQARGWRVAGTCRSYAKADDLAMRGIEAYVFGDDPLRDPATALHGATHILASAPPGPDGDPVLNAHADDIAALNGVKWLGYLSTTGVYGNRSGGWVDETSPLEPSTERGQRRRDAEAGWWDLGKRMGVPVHIFRLAGIYGPGRNQLVSLRDGRAKRIDAPGQVFSRIHVDDIAGVLEKAATSGLSSRAFNVCDDEPAPPAEVVAYAAELLDVEPPPLVPLDEAGLSEMGRSFYSESKRVSNERLRKCLGVDLHYPTYREGLAALAREGEGRG